MENGNIPFLSIQNNAILLHNQCNVAPYSLVLENPVSTSPWFLKNLGSPFVLHTDPDIQIYQNQLTYKSAAYLSYITENVKSKSEKYLLSKYSFTTIVNFMWFREIKLNLCICPNSQAK